MKKILYILFSICLLTACSKDNDGDDDDDLLGIWKITQQDTGYGYQSIDIIPYKNTFLVFEAGNTYTLEGIYGATRGKYERTDNTVICFDEQGNVHTVYNILDLNKSSIELVVKRDDYKIFNIKGYKYNN